MEGDVERDSTVRSPADVLGGWPGGDSTVGAPTDMPGEGFEPRTRHTAVY